MNHQRTIEDALRDAQDMLWVNLRAADNLPDDQAIFCLRQIVRSPAVRSALACGGDTLLGFGLRAVETIVADGRRTEREAIDALWPVLDDPTLNAALGTDPNARMQLRWTPGHRTGTRR